MAPLIAHSSPASICLFIAVALSLITFHINAFSSSSSSSSARSRSKSIDISSLGSIDIKKAMDLIKTNVLLSEVVGQYVSLKSSGSRQYQCKCLFHKDSNPSMGVSDDKGVFNCFSCGAKGDSIQFVRDVEQLSFTDAVKHIVVMAGLDTANLQVTQRSEEELRYIRMRSRQEELLRAACDFYMTSLIADNRAGVARRHLMGRRIRPNTSIKFGIGYAPLSVNGVGGVLGNLTGDGRFTRDEVIGAGLAIDSDQYADRYEGDKRAIYNRSGTAYDRFRDRLMVPIRNAQGAVIGFGGRVLDGSLGSSSRSSRSGKAPKYLNSPETVLFKKGSTLFGLDVARRTIGNDRLAVFVEGYFDVISLHDVGVENVVGVLGTAVSEEHLEAAHRASKGGTVVLMMDSDEAGQAAAERCCLQLLSQADYDVRIASFGALGGSKDPSDLCAASPSREAAAETVRAVIAAAVGWKQWIAQRIIHSGAGGAVGLEEACEALRGDTAALARVLRSLAQFIASLPEGSDRTLLAFFCAERVAGPSAAMRSQLEFDLASMVKKELGKIRSNGDAKIYFPTLAADNTVPPAAQRSIFANSASAYQRPTLPGASSAVPAGTSSSSVRQSRLSYTSEPAGVRSPPLLPAEEPSPLSTPPPAAAPAAAAPAEAPAEAVAEEGPSVDVAAIKNSPPPLTLSEQERRKKFRPQLEVLWEQSVLRDGVLSFGTASTRGRVTESETMLLSIYCHFPALRQATRTALEEFATVSSSSSAADGVEASKDTKDVATMWSDRSHLLLWELIAEVEGQGSRQGAADLAADGALVSSIEAMSDKPAFREYLTTVADILNGAAVKGKEPLALEFIIRDASRLVAAASTRRRQVELLRTEGGQQQAAALQLLAAGIGEQGGGLELGDEFEISLQRQQLQSKLNIMTSMGGECLDGAREDVEMLYWQRGSDTSEQEEREAETAAAQAAQAAPGGSSKYVFDFVDPSVVLTDGELSEEEEMLKRLYSQAGSKQSSGTVSGVTFGLDDIYEDDYGREASPRAVGRSLSRSAPPSKRELANDRKEAYRKVEAFAPFGGSLRGIQRGGRAEQWRTRQSDSGAEIGEIEDLAKEEEERI